MAKPVTRLYAVRDRQWGWALIWITDDGCLSIMSDWGSYSYWWPPSGWGDGYGGDFRKFLIGSGDDYIATKLAGGKSEVDSDATSKGIRERICRLRREGRLTFDQAQAEWELVRGADFESERDAWHWYDNTQLSDASEVLCMRMPMQLQMFMKHVWPLFVVELKRDLGQPLRDAALAWFQGAA